MDLESYLKGLVSGSCSKNIKFKHLLFQSRLHVLCYNIGHMKNICEAEADMGNGTHRQLDTVAAIDTKGMYIQKRIIMSAG